MRLSQEAITAARYRANSMGFALNDIMVASILQAGLETLAGEEVIAESPDIQLGMMSREIREVKNVTNAAIEYLNTTVVPFIEGRGAREVAVTREAPTDIHPDGV